MSYFNINIDNDFLKRKDVSMTEKWIYALIRAEERSGKQFFYSDEGIAEQLGIGHATASRAVKKLIELKLIKAKYNVDGYLYNDYNRARENAFKFGKKVNRYLSTKNGTQNEARNGTQNEARNGTQNEVLLKKDKEAHNAASFCDESPYSPDENMDAVMFN